MAASMFGRASKAAILTVKPGINSQQAKLSTLKQMSIGKKVALTAVGATVVGGAGLVYALNQSVAAAELLMHSPKLPWSHNGVFASLDHAAVRRGYEVYKQVCAACHSLNYICYRHLINVSHTEEEAKQEASEIQVQDGPDDKGNMFMRPGKLADRFPAPYANDEAARAANAGALPPDLSYIVRARHGGEDYIFHLLTGYCDAPAGVVLDDDLYYNPYFAGGKIGMAQAIYNEIIEYGDGTPATQSQLAKDISIFLRWACEPEHDKRKRYGLKALFLFSGLIAISYYYKRHKWAVLKNKKISFRPSR